MSDKNTQEEVGDLFVTETSLTLKLLPSRKSHTVAIRWFAEGRLVNNDSCVNLKDDLTSQSVLSTGV